MVKKAALCFISGVMVTVSIISGNEKVLADDVLQEPFVVENGKVISDQTLQEIVDDYFAAREYSVTELEAQKSSTFEVMVNAPSSLKKTNLQFQQGIVEMQERMEVAFTNFENDVYVLDVNQDENGKIELFAYEWIGIDYGTSSDEASDYMGYGIRHILVLNELDTGEYIVVEDIFSDEYMTGVMSVGYDAQDFEIFEQYILETSIFLQEAIKDEIIVDFNVTASTASSYNVTNAVAYANEWCGYPKAARDTVGENGEIKGTTEHSSYYNPEYPYKKGADCANFVSQCLVAGGLATDTTWYVNSYVWNGAKVLANYLRDNRGFSEVLADNINVYPGNPVFWRNPSGDDSTGHQMICTGKNSAGIPVLNAHNSDIYRVPYTLYANDPKIPDVYTAQIVQNYVHAAVGYSANDTQHWKYCTHCMKKENVASHVVGAYKYDNSNHWRVCTTCSYEMKSTTTAAHTYSTTYNYDASSHWQYCTGCGKKYNNVGHNWILSGTTKTCRFCGYTTQNVSSSNETELSPQDIATVFAEQVYKND